MRYVWLLTDVDNKLDYNFAVKVLDIIDIPDMTGIYWERDDDKHFVVTLIDNNLQRLTNVVEQIESLLYEGCATYRVNYSIHVVDFELDLDENTVYSLMETYKNANKIPVGIDVLWGKDWRNHIEVVVTGYNRVKVISVAEKVFHLIFE